jgi:hypothetical protein
MENGIVTRLLIHLTFFSTDTLKFNTEGNIIENVSGTGNFEKFQYRNGLLSEIIGFNKNKWFHRMEYIYRGKTLAESKFTSIEGVIQITTFSEKGLPEKMKETSVGGDPVYVKYDYVYYR